VGVLARGYAFVVVTLRYFIIGGWAAALALAVAFLPALAATASGGLSGLIPKNTAAAAAETEAARLFGAPLDAPVAVVQRDPHGMPKAALDRSVRQAIVVDRALSGSPGNPAQGAQAAAALAQAGYPNAAQILSGPVSPGPPGGIPGLAGVFPLPNASGLIRGAREHSTTVITFLYFRPSTSLAAQTAGADSYVHWYLGYPSSDVAGVTGPIPAQVAQDGIIAHYLGWVEFFTVLAIAVIVGARFRAVGAPLVTLACAGTAYFLANRIVAWAAERMGASLPSDAGPVLVVLLLGVTTDYSVFFLSGMRANLAEGVRRLPAARLATAEFAPIILAAGFIVAATTASLMVAANQSLREFGPALALTVLTAMAVSMTLTPALMSVFGGLLFRSVPPSRRAARRQPRSAPEAGADPAGADPAADPAGADPAAADPAAADPAAADPAAADPAGAERIGSRREGRNVPRRLPPRILRSGVARFAAARPVALLTAVACIAGLLALAWFARHPRLGSPLVNELPASSTARYAQDAAAKGFAPGILSPTDILVIKPGVASQLPALTRFQRELARQPGVAELAGPATLHDVSGIPAGTPNPLLAKSGNAARFVVVEDTDPLDATAISRVRALTGRLPALARSAGLAGVRLEIGGETALTSDAISSVLADLGRIVVAILVISLVLLAVFLRSLVAPVYLLFASVLAVFASLGLTLLLSYRVLGFDSLVYFVPIAGGVLLVSLGSDYNVFVVGRIWEEARRRAVPDAVRVAAPRASRAITTAGLALAASFAMLAVIPLEQFREIALLMGIGVILDAVVVRSVLVPALVVLFGRGGMWPGLPSSHILPPRRLSARRSRRRRVKNGSVSGRAGD
jgi:RND superfamily putative drug exporter